MGGGGVTNTGYNGMPIPLGIVRTLIHCLGQGSAADKPCTSAYPGMSVVDISDYSTSPAKCQGQQLLKYLKGGALAGASCSGPRASGWPAVVASAIPGTVVGL